MSHHVLCFGELLLRLGAPGNERLLQSPRFDVNVGGAEANVAVSLACFGHRVEFAGAVADNALGAAARAALRAFGVGTGALRVEQGRMGLYFLATGSGLRASSVTYDRAESAFAIADPAGYDWPARVAGIDLLHVSGITPAVSAGAATAALAATRAARAAGALVSFDANFRPQLWAARDASPAPTLHALFAEADVAFADHRDMAVVLGATEHAEEADPAARIVAAARRAFAAFPNLRWMAATVRETHGADDNSLAAVLVARRGEVHLAPARRLSGIVDRIGAGDAFAAGVLHGLLRGQADGEALSFGHAAACLKHTLPGDFSTFDGAMVEAAMRGDAPDVRR